MQNQPIVTDAGTFVPRAEWEKDGFVIRISRIGGTGTRKFFWELFTAKADGSKGKMVGIAPAELKTKREAVLEAISHREEVLNQAASGPVVKASAADKKAAKRARDKARRQAKREAAKA